MGQQQLLLLVLGIVIVGVAILVGINAYSENSVKTNWDSLLQDALRIGNDAQAWKAKPELFGGSPDNTKDVPGDFTAVDFVQLAYAADLVGASLECYVNVNGSYEMTPAIDSLGVRGVNVSNQNQIQIGITGNLESDVNLASASSIKGGQDDLGVTQTVTAIVCVL